MRLDSQQQEPYTRHGGVLFEPSVGDNSYGDILPLLLLQCMYLKNVCVVRELQCVTPSLDWRAAGTLEKEFSSAGFGSHIFYFTQTMKPILGSFYL